VSSGIYSPPPGLTEVPDPIVPTDGTQNVTGNLEASDDLVTGRDCIIASGSQVRTPGGNTFLELEDGVGVKIEVGTGAGEIIELDGDTEVTGTVTLATDLAVSDGGTGASTAIGARTNLEVNVFSRAGTALNPSAAALILWRAPFACTVTNVRGYRVGGTGASVNARRNGTDDHLSSDLSLTSADTWLDGGAVQNASYAVGDSLEIEIVSVSGAPTQVAIQVDFAKA